MSIRITGMNSGLDTDSMVKELSKAYAKKGESTKKQKTKMDWKQDAWTDLNKKIKSFSAKLNNMLYSSSYAQKKTTSSDENRVSVVAADTAITGTQTIEVKNLAKTGYLTSGILGAGTDAEGKVKGSTKLSELGFSNDATITITKGGKPVNFDVKADTTVDEFVKMAGKAGVSVNFDEKSGRIFMNSQKSGAADNFEITSTDNNALKALGLYSYSDTEKAAMKAADPTLTNERLNALSASKIDGQDAVIVLNGATFTSSTNSFSVNGLSITAKGLTDENNPISLNTDTDYDAIYKNIKEVINEYSKLINELDKLYNADSAKDYEPLTDEEKEALSDEEVEKWEQKIKDSLLRRDENVNAVANALKKAGLSTFNVNGKKLALSSFGIETLGYFESADNEKNALHIHGDADDEAVSGETNKLKAMIAGNKDDTVSFFTQYFRSMADNLKSISKTSSTRSYGSFYDDKKMKTDVEAQEKKVADWEKYVQEEEDKYYDQFSRMEKALAKLNATQSSLAGYLGGGN